MKPTVVRSITHVARKQEMSCPPKASAPEATSPTQQRLPSWTSQKHPNFPFQKPGSKALIQASFRGSEPLNVTFGSGAVRGGPSRYRPGTGRGRPSWNGARGGRGRWWPRGLGPVKQRPRPAGRTHGIWNLHQLGDGGPLSWRKVEFFKPWHFSLAQNRTIDSNVKRQGLRGGIELSQMLGLLGGKPFVLDTVSHFHPDTPGKPLTVRVCSWGVPSSSCCEFRHWELVMITRMGTTQAPTVSRHFLEIQPTWRIIKVAHLNESRPFSANKLAILC